MKKERKTKIQNKLKGGKEEERKELER